MSLDVSKLEKVRELAGGIIQARCPACAEGGHDRTGEHLRIYPDGRFGCCVHPKDGEHRKRIFALVGVRQSGTFTLRIRTPPALQVGQSVKAALNAFDAGTVGTGKGGSVTPESNNADSANLKTTESGTLGAAIVKLRACARVDSSSANIDKGHFLEQLKDWRSAVLLVPGVPATERLPFLTADGDLSIPFDSPERFHWWRGGQSVATTLKEVKERIASCR